MKIELGTALLIGVGVLLLTQRGGFISSPSDIPPEPPRGTPEHDKWTSLIVGAFGFAKWLFGPGGPLEGKSQQGVSAAIARAGDSGANPFGSNIFGIYQGNLSDRGYPGFSYGYG